MLPLDDPRWATYSAGYRVPYDASVPLSRLMREGASDELWDELWQELVHQGDVGPASFAAVPWLLEYVRRSPAMDWNAFGLIAVIELERTSSHANRRMPAELSEWYFRALAELPAVATGHGQTKWGPELTQHVVACIAAVRGQRLLARAYLEMSREASMEWLVSDAVGFDERVVERWDRQGT